ncbi:hypothetical protein BAOM_2982 [Peribacillus asahii]|uniref:Uncharacterized protein n=1 Tax=Peribacillus asahii TaxID=228899 RepID=A0A3Q9RP21_9BACI|nr:hypothetical protein [Peribacillus asahii]AZV43591.1 hypothetical protein BAOM_2982 [Peribacillus asahii]
MKLLDLNHSALQIYRTTKGNEGIGFTDAKRKLTRNVQLAIKLKETNSIITYKYGNLLIKVNKKRNRIVWIHNWKGYRDSEGWEENEFMKYILNEDLRIKTS